MTDEGTDSEPTEIPRRKVGRPRVDPEEKRRRRMARMALRAKYGMLAVMLNDIETAEAWARVLAEAKGRYPDRRMAGLLRAISEAAYKYWVGR